MLSIPGTITGGAQTGFTSPTYGTTVDTATDLRSKQSVVTSAGGTQTGVVSHSVNIPFTVTVRRPSILKTLAQAVVSSLGIYSRVPTNQYDVIVRKGVAVANGQYQIAILKLSVSVPAGADTYDPANVRAAVSAMVGVLNSNSAGLGDTVTSGILG